MLLAVIMTDRLETGLVWHRGEGGACAEAAGNDDVLHLRNTLSPDATFALHRDEREALLLAVKEGISTTYSRCPWDTVVFDRVRRSSADTSFIAAESNA